MSSTPVETVHGSREVDAQIRVQSSSSLELGKINGPENGDTLVDQSDMQRLGKKQEFKRNFGLWATLGFISIYMATWEFVLLSLSLTLQNGGLGGTLWVFIATSTLYAPIVASLAEMASMAPTAGGQYHWVSEWAPEARQGVLSYLAGWMSTLGWLASVSSSNFILTTLVQAIITVHVPGFEFRNWQYTLIMIFFLLITVIFSTWLANALPMIEYVSLFVHAAGLVVFLALLWPFIPKNSAVQVFTEVISRNGWGNLGVACLLNQVQVLYCLLGSDSAVHIAEEVQDASLNIPRAIWWTYIANVLMGLAMLITLLFGIGSLDAAFSSKSPYLILFLNTGHESIAYILLIILLSLAFSGNITALQATSREVWAFSRDTGFPFSKWISKINTENEIPEHAVYLTAIIAGLLCCINFGSSSAFEVIIETAILALLSTYMISIGCVLLRRLRGQALPAARWSLGRHGLWINAVAFIYCGFVCIFCCIPEKRPATWDNANYAPLVFGSVLIFSSFFYVMHGTRNYTPPVVKVAGREEDKE